MATAQRHNERPRAATKPARLEARITPAQKALFQRAAALTGRSVTDFVIASAQEAAARAVREHQVMSLSAEASEAFVAALLAPAEPGPRLRRAAERYRKTPV
jgi:uncharacterized protein (DUF1778 family)